jgi:hypothetical protein
MFNMNAWLGTKRSITGKCRIGEQHKELTKSLEALTNGS